MNDGHDAAGAGRLLAMSTVAYSASVEANLSKSPVFPRPVPLEAAFRRFDPLLTFRRTDTETPVLRQAPLDWVVRRVQFAQHLDLRRAVQMTAGFAGCTGRIRFTCAVRRKRATFHIGAHPQDIDAVAGTIVAVYPETVITESTDPSKDVKDVQVLFDLYSPQGYHRAVRSAHGTLFGPLLHLCSMLDEQDELHYEVQCTPTRHAWQANMAALLDAERMLGHRAPQGRTITPKALDEPLFAVVVRLWSNAPRLGRALQAFIGTFTVDGMPLRYRTIEDYTRVLGLDGVRAMLRSGATHTTGQFFSASELALFVQPPEASTVGGIGIDVVSGLSVPSRLTGDGIPLGRNTARGIPVDIVQPLTQHNRSCLLLGRSRSGKSSALVHRVRFLAQQGQGVCIIDPHRTTAFEVLGALDGVDPERIIFLDFDAPTPVAYNPLRHDHPDEYGRLTTEYQHSFKHLFGTDSFHRTNHFLGNAIYACLVLPDANLATIPVLFTKAGEPLRQRVIATVQNPAVRRFWEEEFPTYRSEAFAPLINRFSAFLLDDRTLGMFTQTENRVDIAGWMDDGRVVVIAPPQSIEPSGIVSGCLIAQAKQAAFRRTGTARARRHCHLIVDEWHRYITSATTVEQILHECGKGGLSVALANQETGQLPADLLKAVMTVPNLFVFGVGHHDARLLAPFFNGRVTPETLSSQETGSVHARIDGDIVNFQTHPPIVPDPDLAARIIARSTAYHAPVINPERTRRGRRIIDPLE